MGKIESIIESLLFVWGEPLSYREISKVLELDNKETRSILEDMKENYNNSSRGIELKSFGDNYQFVTKDENYDYIIKLVNKNKSKKLSNSAMEVLSIIAYKQPTTRGEVEEIRGVKSNSSINLLLNRGLIKEVGKLDKIGKPMLFGTTEEFLRVFSIDSLKDLPKKDEIENILEDEELNEDQ